MIAKIALKLRLWPFRCEKREAPLSVHAFRGTGIAGINENPTHEHKTKARVFTRAFLHFSLTPAGGEVVVQL